MKKILLSLLLIASVFTYAQKLTNFSHPAYFNINNGNEQIDKVVTNKNNTIVYMSCKGQKSSKVIVPEATYIIDEQGRQCKVEKADGITLGKSEIVKENYKKTYRLYFPALPKGTTSFDLIQSNRIGKSYHLNIHQTGASPRYSSAVDTVRLCEAVDRAFPDEMFHADTVWLSGQFKGMKMLEREKCSIYVIVPVPSLHDNRYVDTIDISSDGTFKCAVPVVGPMWTELVVVGNDTHDVGKIIPAMLYPGDHLSLTVDNFSSVEPVYHWKSDREIDYNFLALSDVFSTHVYKYYGQELKLDSIKETVAVSEEIAGYLACKYKLTKAQTALLLTHANVSKLCEAMRILGEEAHTKRYEYTKQLDTSNLTASERDSIQSFNDSWKFGILSLLRADGKAFLIVPSHEEFTREMLHSPIFMADISDKRMFTMPWNEWQLYQNERNIHQLRKFRNKPLGADRLLEQWLVIATAYKEMDVSKPLDKEVVKFNMEHVTLPVYEQWKRILLENK